MHRGVVDLVPTALQYSIGFVRSGSAPPTPLRTRISRELDRLELLRNQIKLTEAERDALLAVQQTASPPPAGRMLLDFKGVGAEFAAVLWLEGLFRQFDNRRQLAAYAGLAPMPPGRAD